MRPASSPALYPLKKSAGRESRRIIAAASTDRDSFRLIRAVSTVRMVSKSTFPAAAQARNTVSAHSVCPLPVPITSANRTAFSRGSRSPVSVTAREESRIHPMSPPEICSRIYRSRSGTPSLFSGRGR